MDPQSVLLPTSSVDYHPAVESLLNSSTHELIAVFDRNLRLIGCNEAYASEFYKLFGINIQLGACVSDVLSHLPAEKDKFDQLIEEALSGETDTIENWEDTNHEQQFYDIQLEVLHNDDKQLIGIGFLADNITLTMQEGNEQLTYLKKALSKRRQSQDLVENRDLRYRALIEATHCIVWHADRACQFTQFQKTWASYTGQVWEQHQGRGWLDAVYPEDRLPLIAEWEAAADENVIFEFPLRVWCEEAKEYRHMLMRAVPFFDNMDNFQEWIGIHLDIHYLKQTEENLRLANERLKLALRSARMGTWYWDLVTGQIVWDDAMYELFGRHPGEFEGNFEAAMKLVYPEDRATLENYIQSCLQNNAHYETEFRVQWPDNSIHTLLAKGEIYTDNQGLNVRLIGITWDISKRKQLEAERASALEAARKEEERRVQEAEAYRRKQSEFTDAICHEIRNPLTAMYGALDDYQGSIDRLDTILQPGEDAFTPAMHKSLLDITQHLKEATTTLEVCIKQQKVILDDVLDLSRLEANKIELSYVPFDIKEKIHHLFQMFKHQLAQKDLKFECILPEEELLAKGDPYRLSQVLINLLSNAIKFTPAGRIILKVEVQEANKVTMVLKISVQDTGVGISQETQGRLFNRFSQASTSTASEHGGSGLGLAISSQLVALMGGELECQSKRWHGSTFSFTVAYSRLSPHERYRLSYPVSPKEARASRSLSPQTILIVEDNKLNQRVIKKFIEEQGHHCLLAENGEEVLGLLETQRPHLIFMDIFMPIKNGLEATEAIRQWEKITEQTPVPIVGLSGNASAEYKAKALAAGMNDYITKPYFKHTIFEKIFFYTSATLSLEEKIEKAVGIFNQSLSKVLEETYPWGIEIKENDYSITLPESYFQFPSDKGHYLLTQFRACLEKIAALLYLQRIKIHETAVAGSFSLPMTASILHQFFTRLALGERVTLILADSSQSSLRL